MKTGLSYEELGREILRQAESKQDYVADTRRMQLQYVEYAETDEALRGHRLLLDGAPGEDGDLFDFGVTDHCHGQLGGRLGIPKKYYDRMRAENPQLLVANVNSWFVQKPEPRMVRTLDGNARAFVSNRYRRLDNIDLAKAIFPTIAEEPDAKIVSCDITETKLYVKAVWPRLQDDVKVDDTVQAGVCISNSEVGAGALNVDMMLYVLNCLNGQIMPGFGTKKYHVGRRIDVTEGEEAYRFFADETLKADDEAFFLKVRDLVRATTKEATFQTLVMRMRELAGLKVEADPVQAVELLGNRLDLGDDEQALVFRHLVEGGDLSAWGYVNAVTRTAQDVESYDRATELEQIGGALASASDDAIWKELAVA